MGYWLQSGDVFSVAPSADSLLTGLPVGVYTIEETMSGHIFKRNGDMTAPGRLYGEHEQWADRIMNTFEDRVSNTGVLLTGKKGSGKSLLGRLLVDRAKKLNMPCILIDKPLEGNIINGLLNNLSEPAVIFLDEFDKNFREMALQESVLSLLDGTSGVRHLFIITANNKHLLSEFLVNRPGRMYYNIDFTGLSNDFILEYAEENLKNKETLDGLLHVASVVGDMSFDGLASLVSEMNRYNETAQESVKFLNLSPEKVDKSYTITLTKNGEPRVTDELWIGSPLTVVKSYIYHYDSIEDKNGSCDSEEVAVLNSKYLTRIDANNGLFVYELESVKIILKETQQNARLDYFAF